MKVKDCMCGNVYYATPDTKLTEIAQIMQKNHVGCVPICDNSKYLVGMVTDRDIILRSVATGKDAKTTPASEIMTCNVCTCEQYDDISKVERKMSESQIRRIPVVDNNKVIGILTLGDLAKYNEETGEDHFCTTFEDICGCNGQTKNNY